jgi:phosphate transport system permease protein
MPAILGSLILTLGTAIACIPLAIGAAIYLAEYSSDSRLTRWVRLAIVNLAGIPSIVYGLFGLGAFVLFLNLGTSILAGSLTLGIMTLPVVISTAEEAIRAVPQEFRIVSQSLGATRWQTIRHQVLPHAVPGIMTGIILGLSRAGKQRQFCLPWPRSVCLCVPLGPDGGAPITHVISTGPCYASGDQCRTALVPC